MAKLSSKDLKHRIALCSGTDVVTDGGELVLVRKDVLNTWAKIESKVASMFSRQGFAIMEDRNRQTHLISIRMRRDIDITSAAWIYEERMQSGSRWFKVLGVKDDGEDSDVTILSCKIIQRGEDLAEPVETLATENPGIGLVKQWNDVSFSQLATLWCRG